MDGRRRLNPLILINKRELLGILFRAVSETLLAFGERHLHGTLGGTMILHTWDQTLRDHFHVHCVMAAGALIGDGAWRHSRRNFLFSVRSLAKVFRGKYLAGLEAHRATLALEGRWAALQSEQEWRRLMRELRAKRWVVFSKAPFQHSLTRSKTASKRPQPDSVFDAGGVMPQRSARRTTRERSPTMAIFAWQCDDLVGAAHSPR